MIAAYIVTRGQTRYLDQTLRAVLGQTRQPDTVTVIDVSEDASARDAAGAFSTDWVHAPKSVNLGSALCAAHAAADWIWVLHDDSSPDSGALAGLEAGSQAGSRVGIVGAKIRDWFNPSRLLEIGITATRSGRRFDHVRGELDQGQWDRTRDVLAVSTAGALIRGELWAQLGQSDPALGPFGESLELGRRAHLLGWRVVVEPSAVVYHAEASHRCLRDEEGADLQVHAGTEPTIEVHDVGNVDASWRARRSAQLYNWLLAASPLALPFLILWMPLLQLGRAIWRLAERRTGLAGAELGAGLSLIGMPGKLRRGRARLRATNGTRRQLSRLEVRSSMLRQARALERKVERANSQATEVLEPVAAASLRVRRGRTWAGGAFVAAVGVACSVIFFSPLGWLMHGGSYLSLPTFGQLWAFAWTPWIPKGLGFGAPPDPLVTLLSLDLAPFALLGVGPSSAMYALLVVAPMAAAFGAYLAAGTLTRSVPMRLFAAVSWLAIPAFWQSLAAGRVPTVVVAVAAPVVLWGVVRGGLLHVPEHVLGARGQVEVRPRGGRSRFLALAALALMHVVAAAPALAVAAVVVGLFGLARVRSARWRALVVPVPALLVVAPFAVAAVRRGQWRALLGGVDWPVVWQPAPSWHLLLGSVSGPLGVVGVVSVSLVWLVAVAPLWRLSSTKQTRALAWFALALLSLVAALLAVRQPVAATDQTVFAWPGVFVMIGFGGLLAGACAGWDRALLGSSTTGSIRAALRTVAALAAVVAICAAALPMWQAQVARRAPGSVAAGGGIAVPSSGQIAQQSSARSRVLRIAVNDHGLTVSMNRFERATYVEHSALADVQRPSDLLSADLTDALATLYAGQGAPGLARALADSAVALVVVDPAQSRDLVAQLERTPGLEAIGHTDFGLVWRVADPELTSEGGQVAMRVYQQGTPRRLVPAGDVSASARVGQGKVHLAESPAGGWHATVNGRSLSGHGPTWDAPAGQLRIWFSHPLLWPWRLSVWGSALVLLSAILFTRPQRTRR